MFLVAGHTWNVCDGDAAIAKSARVRTEKEKNEPTGSPAHLATILDAVENFTAQVVNPPHYDRHKGDLDKMRECYHFSSPVRGCIQGYRRFGDKVPLHTWEVPENAWESSVKSPELPMEETIN